MAKSREEMIELIKNLLAHANDTAATPEEAYDGGVTWKQ